MDPDAQTPTETSEAEEPLCGLLVIDKPLGLSSMAVCARVRGALRRGGAPKRVKVGHGGTLDPLASGVLVVLCGKATPLCDRVMRGTKRYLARVDLSAFTTTDDREGERTEVECADTPSMRDVENALPAFVGTVMQRPPAFSAMKVGGRRAYALARKGHTVELEPRPVEIHSMKVTEYDWPFADLDIVSGKGVYIRSIARDLGTALGTGGTLESLRRTAVGAFTIEQAMPLNELPDEIGQPDLLPVDRWIDA
ncbi:MAG: tRNA pseudouridine(55) synthase TruB [Planctomycetota bacterium]